MVRGLAPLTFHSVLMAVFVAVLAVSLSTSGQDKTNQAATIKLPQPRLTSSMSVEEAISKRRSVRQYKDSSLSLSELSQLLWAAQGVTDSTTYPGRTLRTAPSAGALYPLEVYAVVGNVTGIAPGIYKYKCATHELETVSLGDARKELAAAALGQGAITQAVVDIVWTAVYERCTKKYEERAEIYVPIEVGHSAENVFLQATALNLGAVVMGAFYEDKVQVVLKSPKEERALYIMPVGKK
jgi:SagB-type dehydrogenase family enzyme